MRFTLIGLVLFISVASYSEEYEMFFSKEKRDSIHSYCQIEAETMYMTLVDRYTKDIAQEIAIKKAVESSMPDHMKLKVLAIIGNAYKLPHSDDKEKQGVAMNIGENMQYTLCLKENYKKYLNPDEEKI